MIISKEQFYENKMGYRNTYSFSVNLTCKKCKKSMGLTADIIEFPLVRCEDKSFVVDRGLIE